MTTQYLSEDHAFIPAHLHPFIFPLYHPFAIHLVIHWAIPSEQRSGFLLVDGPVLGATHGSLNGAIREVEGRKETRSMYAETRRERSAIMEAVRASAWNAEMSPIHVTVETSGVLKHDFSEG